MERIIWTRELIEQQGYTIPTLLSELGCDNIREDGNRWTASSPFREDKHPSFWIYKDTLHYEDPGEGLKGSINDLCKRKTGQSLDRYLKFNRNDQRNNAFLPSKKKEKVRTFVRTKDYDPADFEIVVEGSGIDYDLYRNPEALEYARSRFMTDEFIDFFHVGYCRDSRIYLRKKGGVDSSSTNRLRFYKRLTLPIIEGGVIASVEGRDITRHQTPKCLYPASYAGNIGGSSYRSLFNIDNLDRSKPLIICEGTMDTVRIWEHITKNVTCTYGSSIKTKQQEVISEFSDVIIFSDSDAGGLVAMQHMDKFYPHDFKVAQLPSGDPGDEINSVDMLKRAIDEAIPFPRWILRYTGRLSS